MAKKIEVRYTQAKRKVQGYTDSRGGIHIHIPKIDYYDEEDSTICHVFALMAHESVHVKQFLKKPDKYRKSMLGEDFRTLVIFELEAYLISALTINGWYYMVDDNLEKDYPILYKTVNDFEESTHMEGVTPLIEKSRSNFKESSFLKSIRHSIAYGIEERGAKVSKELDSVASLMVGWIITYIQVILEPDDTFIEDDPSLKKSVKRFSKLFKEHLKSECPILVKL